MVRERPALLHNPVGVTLTHGTYQLVEDSQHLPVLTRFSRKIARQTLQIRFELAQQLVSRCTAGVVVTAFATPATRRSWRPRAGAGLLKNSNPL